MTIVVLAVRGILVVGTAPVHNLPSREFVSVGSVRRSQRGKDGSGKLDPICPSISFSSEFSRYHAKETKESFDPTEVGYCKLVQQQSKKSSINFLRFRFPAVFSSRETWKMMPW